MTLGQAQTTRDFQSFTSTVHPCDRPMAGATHERTFLRPFRDGVELRAAPPREPRAAPVHSRRYECRTHGDSPHAINR